MNVRTHMSMLFHLDKCIGCHTCSVACKNMWTDRKGAEYMWWNNVETRPGTGYPTQWEDQVHHNGGWKQRDGGLSLRLQSKMGGLLKLFYNPSLPSLEDYYEPFTFRYQDLFNAPAGDDQPTAIPISKITGEPIDIQTGPNWDDDLGGSNIYARNAPYFQLRAQGTPDEQARSQAAARGQEMFPSGALKDSLLRSASSSKTWLLVVIYFTTFLRWLSGAHSLVARLLEVVLRGSGGQCPGADRALLDPGLPLPGGRWGCLRSAWWRGNPTHGAGAVLMTLSHQYGLSVAGEIVMAIGMGVSNAAVFKLVPQAVGGTSGWVGGLGAFGGFLIPPILGAIAASQGETGYPEGFAAFIFLIVTAVALALVFRRSSTKALQPAAAA